MAILKTYSGRGYGGLSASDYVAAVEELRRAYQAAIENSVGKANGS